MNTDLAAQRAIDRLAKAGFDGLNETDKTLAAAWLFDAGVSNASFEGYYSGKRGNTAFYAPAALRTIGATQMAAIAAEANAVFGPDGPSHDRGARQELVRALPQLSRRLLADLEQRFYDCDEDIDALLEAYLARGKQQG